ncbi:MAG: hypothetical protein Q7K11_01100 [Candidatus Berkelbacteria bacterium]|nr:hypothetical protein [Candidatus Berkelbacteria bacterium]
MSNTLIVAEGDAMQTAKFHEKWKKPTETQRKFFERNRLVLPPKAVIAEDIIRFIQEEEGEKYLRRIELVRSLQSLIGTTLDTGETIEYIVFLPMARRGRARNVSVVRAALRRTKGSLVRCGLEYCVKDGEPLLSRECKGDNIDWERYWLFRRHLLAEIVRLSQELLETDPKWMLQKYGGEIKFWIDPRKVSGKRAIATMEHSTGENGGHAQYAVMSDEEATQVGELLARIPLPNGVSIRKRFAEKGVCFYQIAINIDLFQENPV